ncbi:uncharacterized protein [Engystomops pustulosus]|uniref:uncharacterized protein n=1 Tax=Engystomops pustulosus TaxID=76066 RepID=UPI003AFAD599
MTSLTGLLSLLSALIATCHALRCVQCFSTNSTSCFDGSAYCSSGYSCASAYIDIKSCGRLTTLFVRRCLASSRCDFKFSTSNSNIQTRTIFSCCDTDNCLPPTPSLQPFDTEPNGVVCPSYVNYIVPGCNTSETIQCNGDADVCFHEIFHNGSTILPVQSGCASRSYCDNRNLAISSKDTRWKTVCADGATSLQKSLKFLYSLFLVYCSISIIS